MSEDGLVNKIKHASKRVSEFVNNNKEYCQSAAFYLTTRAFDISSTFMVASQKGLEQELGFASKFFINLYGAPTGLILQQTLMSMLILPSAYYVNKKNMKYISGNRVLNGLSVLSLGIATLNFFDYFNLYNPNSPLITFLSKTLNF
jgi:hypothetical protein